MVAEREGRQAPGGDRGRRAVWSGQVSVLVIHGDDDRCQPLERGQRVAELTDGELVVLAGAGHLPHVRDPVRSTG